MTDDFYALLEVPEDASEDDIKEAFRDKVTDYHPDHNDDPRANAQFTALKKAYDTLGDPVERQAYDRLGHENYVAKRLDGLPDADQWSPVRNGPDDGTTDASSRSTTRSSSTSSSRSSGSSSSSSSSRQSGPSPSRSSNSSRSSGTRSSQSSRSTSQSSTSSSRSSAGGGSSSSRSTSSRSTGSSSSGRSTGDSSTSDSRTNGSTTANTSTTRTRRSETASDGAGTTNPSRAHASAAGGGANTATRNASATGAAQQSVLDRLAEYKLVRFLLGWPLVYFASGLYFAGFVGYALRRGTAFRAYLERLLAAGTDVGTLLDALATRGGLDPVGPALVEGLLVGDPVAIVLGLGVVGFPTVLFVLVRLTRRTPGWQPTYLYVVAAFGPLVGVAYGVATTPAMIAELVLFVGAPILTLGVLLGYAKVRPRLKSLLG